MGKHVLLIGYSGHSYVIHDIFKTMGYEVDGYFDSEEKTVNPFSLKYLGSERDRKADTHLSKTPYFISIGANAIRKKIQNSLLERGFQHAINAIDASANISSSVVLGEGIMIGPHCTINALARIGTGTVCNTNSIIEHEVKVGEYCFIAPNSTLLGGVEVGDNSYIGANAVVIQNVKIGSNVTIGAGAVILKDIPDNSKVVGNPQRYI